MIRVRPEQLNEIYVIGAHCDDIAIGAGGTLWALCQARPGLKVRGLVMSGGGTEREVEERAALNAFCPGANLDVTVLKLRDGYFPSAWDEAKAALVDLRSAGAPDLILAPNRNDAHQDHRTVAELIPTVFRAQMSLGYEIVKWDGDLGQANCYQGLTGAEIDMKIDLLFQHYDSQRSRNWYDRETFLGLARIRGIEAGTQYAEAFRCNKVILNLKGE